MKSFAGQVGWAGRLRAGMIAGVLQVFIVLLVIRGFAPGMDAAVQRSWDSLVSVRIDVEQPPEAPEPEAPPSPEPPKAGPRPEGMAAAAGAKASPREVSAPVTRLPLNPVEAAPVSGTGTETRSGAAREGEGTGAAGNGIGTGAGASGNGQGGGGAGTAAVKIAGDIRSARDYPRKTREARIGQGVTIEMTVGADGRARNCRVVVPSPDPASDRITCELAEKRFRFRPATDRSGNARETVYRWRQRWFY